MQFDYNKSKARMIQAFMELLEKRVYQDITVGQIVANAQIGRRTFYRHFKDKDSLVRHITYLLMDEFAGAIRESGARDAKEIAVCYFSFWEEYIEELLLFCKREISYFIGDHIEELIAHVAIQSGHIERKLSVEEVKLVYLEYKYKFAFRLAGYWKVTVVWCQEIPRKTPEEMSQLMKKLIH